MKTRDISVTSQLIDKKKVWELITDIDHWSEWDFNIERTELVKDTRVFMIKHRNFLPAKGVMEEYIPYNSLSLRIGLAGAKLYRKYRMEETEEGLRITISTSVSGFMAWLWNLLVVRKIIRDTPEDLSIIVEHIKSKI